MSATDSDTWKTKQFQICPPIYGLPPPAVALFRQLFQGQYIQALSTSWREMLLVFLRGPPITLLVGESRSMQVNATDRSFEYVVSQAAN